MKLMTPDQLEAELRNNKGAKRYHRLHPFHAWEVVVDAVEISP